MSKCFERFEAGFDLRRGYAGVEILTRAESNLWSRTSAFKVQKRELHRAARLPLTGFQSYFDLLPIQAQNRG